MHINIFGLSIWLLICLLVTVCQCNYQCEFAVNRRKILRSHGHEWILLFLSGINVNVPVYFHPISMPVNVSVFLLMSTTLVRNILNLVFRAIPCCLCAKSFVSVYDSVYGCHPCYWRCPKVLCLYACLYYPCQCQCHYVNVYLRLHVHNACPCPCPCPCPCVSVNVNQCVKFSVEVWSEMSRSVYNCVHNILDSFCPFARLPLFSLSLMLVQKFRVCVHVHIHVNVNVYLHVHVHTLIQVHVHVKYHIMW